MNKSQLRKLAIRRAHGGLNLEEYLRRRHELIDQIVTGKLPIEREIPPPRPSPSAADAGGQSEISNLEQLSGDGSRRVPLHYYFAAGATLCILILIWALWPATERSTPLPTPSPPPVQKISAARTLVESFLALRDYSESAVAEFERGWQQLDSQDQERARAELWFRSLGRNIRDEVKTQRALAQLADSTDSTARIDRLYRLANTLGIASQLPTRSQPQPATATPDKSAAASAPDNEPPAPAVSESATSDTGLPASARLPQQVPTATASNHGDNTATAREWLAGQSAEAFSLQIFAVNKLARVEQLMARHPNLGFQILATDGAEPRFRVYLGSYPDPQQAAQAFDGLAQDVKQAAGKALVKSFADIRAQLAASAADVHLQPAAVAAPPQYTLQLFASDNRDNALVLSHQFSALGLELHELPGSPSPYRVVYGRFASKDLARQARAGLPPELLGRIGTALVKSLSELGISQ